MFVYFVCSKTISYVLRTKRSEEKMLRFGTLLSVAFAQNSRCWDPTQYFKRNIRGRSCFRPTTDCFDLVDPNAETGSLACSDECFFFNSPERSSRDTLNLCSMYLPSYSPNPIDENTSYIGFVFGAIRDGRNWFYNDDKWRYECTLSLQIPLHDPSPQSDIILLKNTTGLGGFIGLCSELTHSKMVDVSSMPRSGLVTQ